MTYSGGQPVRTGNILAAEFINQGREYRALYYETSLNRSGYFSPDGKSVRKAFLRSPIEFSPHKLGIQPVAHASSTEQIALTQGCGLCGPYRHESQVTADGVVTFVGKQGGYGNVVMVSHQGVYKTVYGHLSRYATGIHRGQRVSQGDIIGYVGMTALQPGRTCIMNSWSMAHIATRCALRCLMRSPSASSKKSPSRKQRLP